ncbi:DEHA2F08184p [Debaryomyces hansenii CBS767]|uniref:DEHA2F08184p n=1 Tax=Debaryomyces hansenii (strain ATCC 36239 / CBS 767 / BCRC 21394 / JCM 1990 / NBRC 0083 / IGC 2968) TaxID=284592 RepID=Q6BM55_DEBHA|nr:DEHA2F08184p [Debaryomyces hansenii CBS767]CAG89056.1 DEHA2F08184p [Debaryomyces hansenii CBS767]|eukprot:XP_460716.1 DEHA2F08184p [Debaryomyces hansenii CBS767]
MYKVSEYSNNNHEREDASTKEERTAIEIDTGDAFQDNDYNMSADEDIAEKPGDSINEGERIDEIEDKLLSSGDEDLGAEMHKIGTEVGGDSYRNSVVEFYSEDEIENLEEDEQTSDKETENIIEDEKSDYLSNDSVVELDELNNFEDHDDVQEIPPPNNSLHKREDSGYNNQETLEVREHEELVEDDQDEYDQDENGQDENGQDENADDKIKEIEVNAGGANQEIFEELDNEGFDKSEHDEIKEGREENDVKHEKENDDERGDEQRKKEEEELEEKEIEVQGEQQEDDDGKPVNEQVGYREVRKNENSIHGETVIEGIIEYGNDEKDEVRPDEENIPASSNINVQSKMPNSKLESTFPIIINIAETEFLLVPFDNHRNPEIDVSHLVSLYDDNEILKLTIEEFFGLMRTNEDLNEIHQFTVNKELVLVIPELNLSITEDNIYSRDITIEDFIVSFENLNSNSINDGEELIHKSLSFLLTSQTRFITNFNNLTESIRRGKGFNCVSLENSVYEPIAIAPEARTEDSHKRQSLDSSDETDAQQTKRAKVSI